MDKQHLTIQLDTRAVSEALASLTGTAIGAAYEVMLQQREKGIAKYGVSIEDANLSVEELIRHAQEEAADASVYLAQAMKAANKAEQRAQELEDRSYSQGVVEGIKRAFQQFEACAMKRAPNPEAAALTAAFRSWCWSQGAPVDSPTPGVQSIHRGPDVLLSNTDLAKHTPELLRDNSGVAVPSLKDCGSVELQMQMKPYHEESFNAGITYADRKWQEAVKAAYRVQPGYSVEAAEIAIKAYAPQLPTPNSYVMYWGVPGVDQMKTGTFNPDEYLQVKFDCAAAPGKSPVLVIPL